MSYPPPPGGYDPQQYHISGPEPQQPSDPYSQQGYNAPPPPPPGYGPDPSQQYQDPSQYPPQPPNATPPVGVQAGYPPGAPPGVSPSPLPPPIPPPKQGSNLGIILGIIVALVVVLGVAAVLIVPGMLEDDGGGTVDASDETSSAPAEEESPSPSASPEGEESPSPGQSEGTDEGGGGGSFDGWGTPVNSDEVDPNTPEGAGIAWQIAVDDGDMEALEALMCSNPSEDLQWEYEYEVENNTAMNYDFLIWAISKEPQDGEVEVWAGWTWDDSAPESQQDLDEGGGDYFTAVEEDGTWKLCDITY